MPKRPVSSGKQIGGVNPFEPDPEDGALIQPGQETLLRVNRISQHRYGKGDGGTKTLHLTINGQQVGTIGSACLQFEQFSRVGKGASDLTEPHIEVTERTSMVRYPSEGMTRCRFELVAGEEQSGRARLGPSLCNVENRHERADYGR